MRSYGYGLVRKPRIFQARTETDRARPNGRGLACFLCKALRGASDYTRKQAIADGVQVDVTKTAQEAGIKFPVFLTRGVFETYVAVRKA